MSGDGYLQPRPADYDLDPRLKPQNGQPRPGRHPAGEPKGRFDSGVADLEMHRMSTSPRPKSAAMYEYIDSGSHYEDVPGTLGRGFSHLPNGGMDARQSTVSESRSVLTDVTSDTDDTATIFKTPVDQKRRYNPLYAPNNASAASAFQRNKKQQQIDRLERHLRVQCVFLVLISIVALAALALSIYLVLFQVMDYNNRLMEKYNKLEERTQTLTRENADLKLMVAAGVFNTSIPSSPLIDNESMSNSTELVLTFVDRLSSLGAEIEFTQRNLSQQISQLTSDVNTQLLNISKMPGPPGEQGEAGMGNFSTCAYSNYSSTTVASSSPSATFFHPTLQDLQNQVILFAACGVTGGTGYSLQTKVITPYMVQYRCECYGQLINHNDRTCIIHFVTCPRVTGNTDDVP